MERQLKLKRNKRKNLLQKKKSTSQRRKTLIMVRENKSKKMIKTGGDFS